MLHNGIRACLSCTRCTSIYRSINANRPAQVFQQTRSILTSNCIQSQKNVQNKLENGPSLEHFITNTREQNSQKKESDSNGNTSIPYLEEKSYSGNQRKVYFDVFGCQMNVNDTEIAWGILQEHDFQKTTDIAESDVILIMTCSIREGAEEKIWKKLEHYKHLKKRRAFKSTKKKAPVKIGILGCMAERLKQKIVEKEKAIDLVCGPDAYRDLPRMLAVTESGQAAVNVLLSLEETYADVVPVRLNNNSPSAFVSIMRGCDNMCTYCIVPFTRGRERSRPINSILEEVQMLSESGIKEITLLGQNVNSYRDKSDIQREDSDDIEKRVVETSRGFSTVYKPKKGGRLFADLLDQVSLVDPEMRIRFTSPHPKDFPDEVLHLINERPNICNQIHLPAQSGSTDVLKRMRRGYTREAYLDLVHHVWNIVPGVSLTSDFIAGFCGETEEDHKATVDMIRQVKYSFAFCFPYSMRQKTHAHHRLVDDVPQDVKQRRHEELVTEFRRESETLNRSQIGQTQLILVEGVSKRSDQQIAGRNDGNTKVIVDDIDIPDIRDGSAPRKPKPGDYMAVEILNGTSQTLTGKPLYLTSLTKYADRNPATRI